MTDLLSGHVDIVSFLYLAPPSPGLGQVSVSVV